ncbi:hypothetical protein VIBC2010_05354 [Vibrio caribbeanicus ATCC BAA-2122]|uniref:Uncharacterized protein n=2 Tax=Vibrio caribbeanicus TaxID=701175 RepID=E3BKJ0_9VIBR|nr:hypothetical protein VIBC2010_05354 [Vibrio caribbeanicus ATCC BAA-2122]
MSIRYREIHRAEIKRLLYSRVKRTWNSLLVTYASSLVLIIGGADLIFESSGVSAAIILGLLCQLMGVGFFFVYKSLARSFKRSGYAREWLSSKNMMVVCLIIVVSDLFQVIFQNQQVIILAFGTSITWAYANWKLRINIKPLWRIYYYKEARIYLRQCYNKPLEKNV